MTYNAEITFADTYISYIRVKDRATRSKNMIKKLDFIDKNPIENRVCHFAKIYLVSGKCIQYCNIQDLN